MNNSARQIQSTDSPLVIDLPDGQKLFVGKIDSGTVIEVATWRGTGRPDSRTNRIIVGMSSGEIQAVSNQPTTDSTPELSKWKKIWKKIYTSKNDHEGAEAAVEPASEKAPRKFRLPKFNGFSRKKIEDEPEVDEEVADFLANIHTRATNQDKIQKPVRRVPATKKKSVAMKKVVAPAKKKAPGKKR